MMDHVQNKASKMYSAAGETLENTRDEVRTADPKLRTAGCVAAALATAAAAPYVVPAAVSAIGFTKVGVAAGSAAAYLMSATGTWSLGMPIVSAIQSVGAAGLGTKGAVVAGFLGYKVADKMIQRRKQEPMMKSKL